MGYTTDREDPRLGHGVDDAPTPIHEVYLILSDEERAKGFVRPLRRAYRHVGPPGPRYELQDLTQQAHNDEGYVKYEPYPESERPALGRYWTQEQLDQVDQGCGTETRMGLPLCETYARNPKFYGATYCVGCQRHLPVNAFVWVEDGQRVGS